MADFVRPERPGECTFRCQAGGDTSRLTEAHDQSLEMAHLGGLFCYGQASHTV